MSRQRACLYLRQSDTDGDGDNSVSIHSQEALLRDLADRRGDLVLYVEVDADLRGWQDESERDGLRAVKRLAAERQIDVVYVYDLSRLARGVLIQELLFRDFDAAGVTVVSYREPFAEQKIFRQILAVFAEERTRELQAHSRRAIAERGRRGIAHGIPPLGYAREARRGAPLIIDSEHPERVAAVQWIFGEFVRGRTYSQIAQDADRMQWPTARGNGWRIETIRRIVRNPAYIGHVVHHGETVATDAHPALIDDATWQLAQERVATLTAPRPRRKAYTSWLEGLLFHACGKRMYLMPDASEPRFRCSTNFRQAGPGVVQRCEHEPRSIMRSRAEDAVWSQLCADVASLVDADSAIAAARRLYIERTPDAARQRAEVERRLRALDDQVRRAEDLYLSGERTKDWLRARESLVSQQRLALVAERDGLPPEPDDSAIRFAESVLRDLSAMLPAMPPGRHRTVLLARLGAAFFNDGKIELRYYAPFASLLATDRVFDQRVHIAQFEQHLLARLTLMLLGDEAA